MYRCFSLFFKKQDKNIYIIYTINIILIQILEVKKKNDNQNTNNRRKRRTRPFQRKCQNGKHPQTNRQGNRRFINARVHAAGRGVQDHLGVGVQPRGVLIGDRALPSGAAHPDGLGRAQRTQGIQRRFAGAAGAQDQRLFAAQEKQHP